MRPYTDQNLPLNFFSNTIYPSFGKIIDPTPEIYCMTSEDNSKGQDIRLVKSGNDLWLEAKAILKKKLSHPRFQSWITPLHLASLENNQANIAVKNDYMRGIIAGTYIKAITEALSQVTKEKITCKITIDPTLPDVDSSSGIANVSIFPEKRSGFDEANTPESTTHPSNTVNNTTSNTSLIKKSGPSVFNGTNKSGLSSKHTFNTFVVGSNNRFCHSAALSVAENPGHSYNPLFLYGGVGLGKTHIMQAIGHEILLRSPHLSVRYMTCERFTNELINSIRDDRMVEFRRRYRQVDVLLMDDIQFIQGKESTQEEFFHTFNALREGGKQIVLSSDRPPKAISLLEERLKSRFEWGLIADIQAPDLETRVAILRKKSEMEKMNIPEDVIGYIASVFVNNIRELEGALLRSHAYSNMTGTELSVRSMANILAPVAPTHTAANVTLESIIEVVSQHYRIEPSEMRSPKRSQDLALPRHIAMYLAHDLIQLSFPRIGQAFANRKHTSALYAHAKVKEAMLTDHAIAEAINQIIRKLNS
jgi:chromosomal replication initiator protein